MRFRVRINGQCGGGNHIHGEISINGGAFRDFEMTREELRTPEPEERREAVIQRLRSAILEAGATTPLQMKNAVEAREFEI